MRVGIGDREREKGVGGKGGGEGRVLDGYRYRGEGVSGGGGEVFLPGLGDGGSQGAAHSVMFRLGFTLGDGVSMSRSDGSRAGSAHREEIVGVREEHVVASWLGVVGVAAMKVGVCSWC